MSTPAVKPPEPAALPTVAPVISLPVRRRPWRRIVIGLAAVAIVLGLAAWGGVRLYGKLTATHAAVVPTTVVKRGDLTVTVTAKARLEGGNSEMLTAPMSGGNELHIKFLRKDGDLVKPGDVVVELDPTEQEYKLREAEADLAEAEAHLSQARAEAKAQQEEDRYALLKAQSDVKQAELDVRKNKLLSTIAARQNDLALDTARDQLKELQTDLANKKATGEAGIAMQEAASSKAKMQADTARKNIENMTLRTKNGGYVAIQQNTNLNFMMWGQALPIFQVGDAVRPGMAVAQIPDLKNWDASATIGELDRGHLAIGQKVNVTVVALPNRHFTGRIKEVGGTGGAPWDRHFECKIAVENPAPEMRPGMSGVVSITTDTLKNVLWVPAQAVFESDGRTFVYVRSGASFVPADIKLLRRSESRVALSGLSEGQTIALTSPEQVKKQQAGPSGAMKAIQR